MAIAHRMKERIVQEVGGCLSVNGVNYQSFPEPSKVAAFGESGLFELTNNPKKAQYLLAAAEAFSKVDEVWLRTASYDEVYSWLTDIKGIGDWSANFVMIRGLGRMEKLSGVGEKLAMAVGKIYSGNENSMSEEAVLKLAEKYGKWQGYWAYYIRIFSEFEPGKTMQHSKGSWMQIA